MGNKVTVKRNVKKVQKMYMITIYQKYVEEGKVLGLGSISQVSTMILEIVNTIIAAANALSMDFCGQKETAVIDGEVYVTGWHIYLNSLERTHRITIDEYKTQG